MSISGFISQHGGYMVASVLFAALAAFWLFSRRVPPYLSRWAQGRKVYIMQFRRPFLSGPFSGYLTAKYDHLHEREVYYLRVREQDGRERKCWVLCSADFMSGVEVVEVEWV